MPFRSIPIERVVARILWQDKSKREFAASIVIHTERVLDKLKDGVDLSNSYAGDVPATYFGSAAEERIKKLGPLANEFAQWLLHSLVYKEIKSKKDDLKTHCSKRSMFPYKAEFLQRAFHGYQVVREILVEESFLEFDPSYVKGERSQLYGLTWKSHGQSKDPDVIDKVDAWIESHKKSLAKKFQQEVDSIDVMDLSDCLKNQLKFQAYERHQDALENWTLADCPITGFLDRDKSSKKYVTVEFKQEAIRGAIDRSRKNWKLPSRSYLIQRHILNGYDEDGNKYVTVTKDILKQAEQEYQDAIKASASIESSEDRKKKIQKAADDKHCIESIYEWINSGNAYFTVCPMGRAHTPITVLPSRMLKHLRILGKPVYQMDFVNSQPAIYAYLLSEFSEGREPLGSEEQAVNKICELMLHGDARPVIGSDRRKINPHLIRWFSSMEELKIEALKMYREFKALAVKRKDEIKEFQRICSAGRYYEEFAQTCDENQSAKDGVESKKYRELLSKDRSAFKKIVYQILFASDKQVSGIKREIKEACGGVFVVLDKLKELDYGLAAKAAQSVEAEEIFERVLPRVQEESAFALTRHDSILLPTNDPAIRTATKKLEEAFNGSMRLKRGVESKEQSGEAKCEEATQPGSTNKPVIYDMNGESWKLTAAPSVAVGWLVWLQGVHFWLQP